MAAKHLLIAIGLLGLCSFFSVKADQDGEEWEYFLKNLVNSSYDHRIRPYTGIEKGLRKPTEITVNIYLRVLEELSTQKGQIKLQLTFRQEWEDPRLAYKYLAEDRKVPEILALSKRENENLIWIPDTFFQNEIDAQRHTVQTPNMLFLVQPDGHVLYSERLSLTLACPMSFEHYPWGKQVCSLDIASYSFTAQDITYKWKLMGEPIQKKRDFGDSSGFELEKVETDTCTSITRTGEYACLRLRLQLRKEASSDILHAYIPTMMLVIISFTSFFFNKKLLVVKVMIVMLAMVSLIILSVFINQKLPVTSYCKAIDGWMGASFLFIFLALIEVTLVAVLEQRRSAANKEPQELRIINDKGEYTALVQPTRSRSTGKSSFGEKLKKDPAGAIDFFSRLIFPLLYFLYVIIHFIAHAWK